MLYIITSSDVKYFLLHRDKNKINTGTVEGLLRDEAGSNTTY